MKIKTKTKSTTKYVFTFDADETKKLLAIAELCGTIPRAIFDEGFEEDEVCAATRAAFGNEETAASEFLEELDYLITSNTDIRSFSDYDAD